MAEAAQAPLAADGIEVDVAGSAGRRAPPEDPGNATGSGEPTETGKKPRRTSILSLGSNPSSLSEWSRSLGNLFRLLPKDDVTVVEDKLEEVYNVRLTELATGKFGVVRAIQHKTTKQKFVVKTVMNSKAPNIALFQSQLRIAFRVRHPHVVKLLEVFEGDDCVHMVMERCAGGNLHQKIFTRSSMRSNGLPLKSVAPYIAQMLKGIAYLHHYRIAHRDVKAGHFLLVDDKTDQLKLTDFFTACVFSKDGLLKGRIGTAPFFAPDVLEDKYSCKCDVWGVGVVSYMLVTGKYPLPAESIRGYEEMLKARQGISFEGREWIPFGDEGINVVQQLLRWNPEERPPAKKVLGGRWLRSNGMPQRCCSVL